GWDDGLICGGTAHIFLQPRPAEQAEIFREAVALHAARGRAVLALVAAGEPGSVGRMCLVREGEASLGDLANPALQSAVEEKARELLESGGEDPRRVLLKEPAATVYLEPLLPKPVCFIAGAGHIGAALSHYAARAGFEVAIVDDRPSLCNPE